MMSSCLGAICFDTGEDVDSLFEEIVKSQLVMGYRVCGVLQTRGLSQGECHCSDMDLNAIGSKNIFRISQSLGQGSSGCRLHPGALAECSAFLENEIKEGCDLLILNRYGKGESEGRGFRDLISFALSKNIPVLMALRPNYRSSFKAFAGEMGAELPFDKLAIEHWLADIEQAHVGKYKTQIHKMMASK